MKRLIRLRRSSFATAGWTDGLPVIPPTDERVAAFLGHLKRGRDEVLEGSGAPASPSRWQQCGDGRMLSEYAPVVVAAVEAILQPAFNLVGPSASLGAQDP